MNRSTLATMLDDAKIPSLVLALLSRSASPWITVLTYHRAGSAGMATDFDDGVVDVTPDALERHAAYLKRFFSVIGIDDLLAFRRGGALPKNPVLLTFDDGYLDNHDVVLPILKKYGLKAVFFIATDYVNDRRLFWWDKINLLIKRTSNTIIRLHYPTRQVWRAETIAEKKSAIDLALRTVKDHHGLDLPRYIEELAVGCNTFIGGDEEAKMANTTLMTWDHVKALRAAGMDVQSHTASHRVLQTLTENELARELGSSREVLEGVLREPVRTIAYPVGKPLQYTPDIRTAIRAAGYELGFSNGTGVNLRWSFDPFDVKRIALDGALSDAFFRSIVAMPYLAY